MDYQKLTSFELWGNNGENYFKALVILAVLTAAFKIFQVIILKRLSQISKKTPTDIDDLLISLVKDVKPPFYFFISLYVSLKFLELAAIVEKIINAVFIIVIAYQVILILQRTVDYAAEKIINRTKGKNREKDKEVIGLISKIFKISLWAVGVLLVLSNLGVNVTSVVAGLGIGGIAIALAVQNILGDVFASFSIFIDKPFEIGDYIVAGKESGTVQKIGIKTTRLKTLQGEELVVPNKDLTDARIQNFKRMEKRRVVFTLGVVYGTSAEKLEKIPTIVKEIISGIDSAVFSRAHFSRYGDFSLDYEVVYFVDSPKYEEYMDIQQEVNLAIYKKFAEEEIEFAYPTQTVFLTHNSQHTTHNKEHKT